MLRDVLLSNDVIGILITRTRGLTNPRDVCLLIHAMRPVYVHVVLRFCG